MACNDRAAAAIYWLSSAARSWAAERLFWACSPLYSGMLQMTKAIAPSNAMSLPPSCKSFVTRILTNRVCAAEDAV